ncbi:MAG TPA: hypothetical protein ENK06_05075, partial [Gammaproteobacteria bacterium]|nr:hypothetical protein [Gammaproteobacteria bacterium]
MGMKGLARFAEYSMTGGILWTNVFVFATLIYYQPVVDQSIWGNIFSLWIDWSRTASHAFSPLQNSLAFGGSFSSVLTTLGIILIFCSGLLLSLISPLFCVPFEMLVFRRKLIHENNQWLDEIISHYQDFMQSDYVNFKAMPIFSFKNFRQCHRQQAR